MIEINTKRIEILVGTLATGLMMLALAYYILLEPGRLGSAQGEILNLQLDDAMTLYAENCAVCHGLQGEGIGSIPPLDSEALRSMDTTDLTKTIARGRFNTAMPAWSQSDGGPLSDYQIDELVNLIQSGDWNATKDRVVNLDLAPLVPFTTEPDPALLAQVGTLADGTKLQTAIGIFAAECVSCHGADGLGTGIAPALNDPTVRARTAEVLNRTITFGSAGTLMSAWNSVLSADEITAMVALIQRWDEVPLNTVPAPEAPIPTTAESIARGGDLYASNCSACHGPEGQGTRRAPSLNVKSFLTDTSDQAIQQIVTNGAPGTAMTAWGARMSEADIQAIIGFIRQWESTAPEVASPIQGGLGPPWRRNTTTTTTGNSMLPSGFVPAVGNANQSSATGQNTADTNGTGSGIGPAWAQTGNPAQPPLDWRLLLGITVILSIAFSLTGIGYTRLKKAAKN